MALFVCKHNLYIRALNKPTKNYAIVIINMLTLNTVCFSQIFFTNTVLSTPNCRAVDI